MRKEGGLSMKELSKKKLSKFEKNSKILENLKKELPFIDVEHKTCLLYTSE